MLENVVVTGGGTGGHVYTGIAILDEVRRRNPRARTVFLGSDGGYETRIVPRTEHEAAAIGARALRLNGARGAVRALAKVPRAVLEARAILARLRPEVVLGVGGPASGPSLVAARLLGLPSALHEQNAVPGLSNRLAGSFVSHVLVGLPQVRGRFVSRSDVVLTGNPVRAELLPLHDADRAAPGPVVRVLALGGSDGCAFMNERVPAVIAQAAAMTGRTVSVVHQCGTGNKTDTIRVYRALGVNAEVTRFMDDMTGVYREADLAITLAGAGTLGELSLAGTPTLVVPLATAADDHQRENAWHFARHGAIRLVDQNEWRDDAVAHELARMIADDDYRATLSARFRSLARPDAAAAIVDELERIARDRG